MSSVAAVVYVLARMKRQCIATIMCLVFYDFVPDRSFFQVIL
jgi:hypothetical protein